MAKFSVSPLCSPPSPRLQLHRQPFFTVSQPIAHPASSATDSNFTFTFATTSNLTPKVVVTRERGKNNKLINALVLTSTVPLPRFYIKLCLILMYLTQTNHICFIFWLHASLICFCLISLSHVMIIFVFFYKLNDILPFTCSMKGSNQCWCCNIFNFSSILLYFPVQFF